MKTNTQTTSKQGKMHFPLIILTIVAVALFGMTNFGYSEEMSVDDRVKAF